MITLRIIRRASDFVRTVFYVLTILSTLLISCGQPDKLGLNSKKIDKIERNMKLYLEITGRAFPERKYITYDYNTAYNYFSIGDFEGDLDSLRNFGSLKEHDIKALRLIIKSLSVDSISGFDYYENIPIGVFLYKRNFLETEYYERRFLCLDCDSIIKTQAFYSFFYVIDSAERLYYFRYK